MESLPDIVLPDAATLADDRSPAPPPEIEQCASRCTTSIRRLEAWLATGTGTQFSTFHPAAFQQMFSDRYRAELEAAGFTLAFLDDQLTISK